MARREMVGDIFSMKLSNDQFGFGQILWKKGSSLRVGIYDKVSDEETMDLDSLTSSGFLIIQNTVNAFFGLERWNVIAHGEIAASSAELPTYKLHTINERSLLMDINGKILGEASPQDQENLNYHKSFSPISFSNALEVKYGIRDYDPYFERMFVKQ